MSNLPTRGRCQKGRTDMLSHKNKPMCTEKALPGRFYCNLHLTEAYARLPDRRIGDNRPVRWTAWTSMSRGDG